jgi:hypothetical protein
MSNAGPPVFKEPSYRPRTRVLALYFARFAQNSARRKPLHDTDIPALRVWSLNCFDLKRLDSVGNPICVTCVDGSRGRLRPH